MLRLADRIMLTKSDTNSFYTDLRHQLTSKHCKIIIADNIYTYLGFGTAFKQKESFLNINCSRAPFDQFFVEYSCANSDIQQEGIYCVCELAANYTQMLSTLYELNPHRPRNKDYLPLKSDTHTILSCHLLQVHHGTYYKHPHTFRLELDITGNLIAAQWRDTESWHLDLENIDMYPVLLLATTLAFMNCKNVIVQDDTKEYAQPAKWYRRTKVPQVSYHTINIQPRTISRNPNPTSTGIQQRLHICRGHFMHYKEDGPGMFGRGVYGRFWVPQHPRGSKELGEVNARYNVNPPDFNLTSANTMV